MVSFDFSNDRPVIEDKVPRVNLVIDGGTIITMVDDEPVISQGRIEVSGGLITKIGKSGEHNFRSKDDVEIIDARNAIVMPGLVNCHTHAAMSLFRGLADDLPLKTWLFEKIFPAEAALLDPKSVHLASLLACVEMIASGTTCFMDGYFFEEATFDAAKKAGLRAILAQGVIDMPAPGVPDQNENLNVARNFVERRQTDSNIIKPAIFCHSPVTCYAKTLQKASEICKELKVPFFIHLSETKWEVEQLRNKTGEKPVIYLDSLGILDENLIAVHGVYLDNEEINLIAEKGAKIVHVPESNMKLASGIAPLTGMILAGIRPGLGTDGCASNNNLDMFSEMDMAAKTAKIATSDPTAFNAMSAAKMATSWGSAVAGLDKHIGTLQEGKCADIVIIDTFQPHLRPCYDPLSNLVYSANGSDVRDVIVEGKVLLRERRFTHLDPLDIMKEIKTLAAKVEKHLPHVRIAGN
ncbi:MAG: amidohydrolase [Desulfobacteraceae bacterium]|jgi:5-methylthioadenosine/S-adenosylhomocysteine deaminase|nr:MAG: amidohydrolase [Desulfobacteraceae bacterium]